MFHTSVFRYRSLPRDTYQLKEKRWGRVSPGKITMRDENNKVFPLYLIYKQIKYIWKIGKYFTKYSKWLKIRFFNSIYCCKSSDKILGLHCDQWNVWNIFNNSQTWAINNLTINRSLIYFNRKIKHYCLVDSEKKLIHKILMKLKSLIYELNKCTISSSLTALLVKKREVNLLLATKRWILLWLRD